MKKIALGLALALTFSLAHAKSKYEPECGVSGFDNMEVCTVKPYGVYVSNKITSLSTVAFGGIWVSGDPKNVLILINLGDMIANVDQVSFNVDGKIDHFKVDIKQNKIIRNGMLSSTSSAVFIPVEYIETMLNAKDVKYRVTTISNGYRDGSFYSEKGVATEPIKTLNSLLSHIKQQSN